MDAEGVRNASWLQGNPAHLARINGLRLDVREVSKVALKHAILHPIYHAGSSRNCVQTAWDSRAHLPIAIAVLAACTSACTSACTIPPTTAAARPGVPRSRTIVCAHIDDRFNTAARGVWLRLPLRVAK